MYFKQISRRIPGDPVDFALMSATLDGVNGELRERVEWVLKASQIRFWVSYGFRTLDAQWDFWNQYQAAKKAHPLTWRNYAPLAAYPGTSDHGKVDAYGRPNALAVDIGCLPKDDKLRANLAYQAGLEQKVKGEPWHLTLRAGRGPLSPSTVEEDDMPDQVTDGCMAPSGMGRWILKRDGAVETWNFDNSKPIPFFGSMYDYPKEQSVPGRYFVAIEPVHKVGSSPEWSDGYGYWIIANDGYVAKMDKVR